MAKYVKPNEAASTLGVCLRTLRRWEEEGKIKAVKTPSGQRRYDIQSFIKKNQNLLEDAPLLSMLASLPDLKKQTLIDKLNDYQRSTQAQKLLRKWEEDSILGGKDLSPFWDEFCEAISQLLWLPTKTDLQGSAIVEKSKLKCRKNLSNSHFMVFVNALVLTRSSKGASPIACSGKPVIDSLMIND